jgi:hypothetical protein
MSTAAFCHAGGNLAGDVVVVLLSNGKKALGPSISSLFSFSLEGQRAREPQTQAPPTPNMKMPPESVLHKT